MPRTHIPGASTLRNRNRITNKTRLRIIRGNVDAEDLLIPDEDDEKHRLTNLVAGVDAEDANEHHLQEVLSAAHRSQAATKKAEDTAKAYIPTPDSNGLVDNYQESYPDNVWKDPATFVCTSTTVEESISDGLANGFSYFMDERDKEWLDKNNEEARGEGTSAQGAISASGTRTSARSAKAKGKEPDLSQPVVITEDEFELVMGLFEKVTHEKTEFLHHSLETGMPFPAYTEYQDTFTSPLPPSTFASHTVPKWIQEHQGLARISRTIYPYWKERRIERAGHRIIPTLNFDESDTLNESYICFRRREIKAVRKTRQAQVTSSDKLIRLQGEFAYPLELARQVLQRETIKKEQAVLAQQVWERRMALADLKRKFPSLSDKNDEELLIDKERPAKRVEPQRLPGVKIPPNNALLQPLRPDPVIKPRERQQAVREKTEAYLARKKEEDKIWDDVIDNPTQTPYVPYASKLFKWMPPASAPQYPSDAASDKTSDDEDRSQPQTALRLRHARNNRLVLDRRDSGAPRPIVKRARSALLASRGKYIEEDDEDPEESDRRKRQCERWRFDADDVPPSHSADEDNRVLVDDFKPVYLRHSMTLLRDSDHIQELTTDPTLFLPTADGRQQTILPYRLGMPPMVRPPHMRPPHPGMPGMPPPNPGAPGQPGMPVGTPVSMQQHMKKMQPPSALPQMRISNGGMRPPALPTSGLNGASTPQTSTPQPVPIPPAHIPVNGVNGPGRAAIAMPHVEMVKPPEATATAAAAAPAVAAVSLETTSSSTPQDSTTNAGAATTSTSTTNGVQPQQPQQLKPQNGMPMAIPNGFHVGVAPVNPTQTAAAFVAGNYQPMSNVNVNGVNMNAAAAAAAMNLGKVDLKMFANMPPQQLQAHLRAGTFAQNFIHAAGGAGVNGVQGMGVGMNGVQGMQGMGVNGNVNGVGMKIPPGVRQLHFTLGAGMQQRPAGAMNVGVDGSVGVNANGAGVGVNGGVGSPNPAAHLIPVRTPSSNGMRPGMRVPSAAGMALGSPHMQVQVQQQQQQGGQGQSASPTRPGSMTPSIGIATPPMQHQQPVGSTQNGY